MGGCHGAAFSPRAEVSLILAFLNVIDNPDQDIPLLSVLMSPIYGFTAEDMAQLRRECGGETLYVSLLRAENERCVRVRDELTRFRALASTMPADSFINMLCTETGYENIVRAMPGRRKPPCKHSPAGKIRGRIRSLRVQRRFRLRALCGAPEKESIRYGKRQCRLGKRQRRAHHEHSQIEGLGVSRVHHRGLRPEIRE